MRPRNAFALVELLVVVAIIGTLVAILVPAIQAARAAGRRTQCLNNHKQVALAVVQHGELYQSLPEVLNPKVMGRQTPHCRFDPIGWRYTITPFIEEGIAFDTLADADNGWEVRAHAKESSGPGTNPAWVAAYHCPTTPEAMRFMDNLYFSQLDQNGTALFDSIATEDNYSPIEITSANILFFEGETREGAWYGYSRHLIRDSGPTTQEMIALHYTPAKLKYFLDGMSHTILVGEESGARRPASFCFASDETWRGTTVGINRGRTIRSWHSGGAHVSMADGAVRFLVDDIADQTMAALLGRQDGDVVGTRL